MKAFISNLLNRAMPHIGRNWYRLLQGSSVAGLFVGAAFTIVNFFGIWKPTFEYYNIPLIPFMIIGFFAFVGIYWATGFTFQYFGVYKWMQSFMNNEVNPEWNAKCAQFDRIEKKLDELLKEGRR
jgi:hypothetical protein